MKSHSKPIIVAFTLLLAFVATGVVLAETPPIEVHGYMQNRFYNGPESSAEFRVERVSVSAAAKLPNESNAYVELYYHPWAPSNALYVESAYYETKLGEGRIKVGKGRNFTFGMTPVYPNRKTSNYGITAEAFTQDRVQGVQYVGKKDNFEYAIGALQSYRLGSRAEGAIPGASATRNAAHSVPHLSFRDPDGGMSDELAVSARVGGEWNGLKAGLSVYSSKLDKRDLAELQSTSVGALNTSGGLGTNLVSSAATSRTQRVWGPDITWKSPSGVVLQGEYYDAKVSELGYSAWNALIGWDPPTGWRFYARYGEQDMDGAPTDNRLSWDISQIQLSAVQPLRKGLWLQYEYEINREDSYTGAKVRNNIFFVELFAGF